ncbi:MAG: peptidoglycan-binding protein [Candidatus Polarisedimenticolaceae bacterium]|nr:peptidoglycan-binding protein [Candidatus Polarisedimenticolaceae bacterium]
MNKMKKTALALLICTAPFAALGADKDGRFAIKGAGTASCERYLEERGKRSEPYYLIAGWLNGYLTAANQYADETYDLVAWQNSKLLNALLETHCKANPKQQIHIAVRAMTEGLRAERLREMSMLVKAKSGEEEALLYQETLRRIQTKLANLGFYTGAADGQFGPGTRKALEAFQTQHKLKVTGLPNQTTIYMLLITLAKK